MNEPFDNEIGIVTAVLALFGGAVRECVVRTDVIGVDLPLLWISRNLSKEDQDRIAAGELEFLAFDSRSPFVESTIGWTVVRLVMHRVLRTMTSMRGWRRSRMTTTRRWGRMIIVRRREWMRRWNAMITWYSCASSWSRIWLRSCCQRLLLLGRGLRSGRNCLSEFGSRSRAHRVYESCESSE